MGFRWCGGLQSVQPAGTGSWYLLPGRNPEPASRFPCCQPAYQSYKQHVLPALLQSVRRVPSSGRLACPSGQTTVPDFAAAAADNVQTALPGQ